MSQLYRAVNCWPQPRAAHELIIARNILRKHGNEAGLFPPATWGGEGRVSPPGVVARRHNVHIASKHQGQPVPV